MPQTCTYAKLALLLQDREEEVAGRAKSLNLLKLAGDHILSQEATTETDAQHIQEDLALLQERFNRVGVSQDRCNPYSPAWAEVPCGCYLRSKHLR